MDEVLAKAKFQKYFMLRVMEIIYY